MKKFKFWMISAMALCCALIAFPMVGMAEVGFSIAVEAEDGGDAVMPGYTYTYRVSVNHITEPGGLVGLQNVTVIYDKNVFEQPALNDVTGEDITGWQMERTVSTPGTIVLNPNEKDGDAAHAVTKDGVIVYHIKLKVKQNAPTEPTTVSVTKGTGTSTSLGSVSAASFGTVTVKFRHKLPAPTGLTWNGNVAVWQSVAGAEDYAIQLYRNTAAVDDAMSTGGAASYDFSDMMTEGGSYTFRVIAIGGTDEYEDSEESPQSVAKSVVGRLATPKIRLMSDLASGGLKYQIIDTNPNASVSAYFVEIYRKGATTPIKSISVAVGNKAGSLSTDDKIIVVGLEYGVTVKAISAAPGAYHDSGVSEMSTYETAVDIVSSIAVKSLPTTTYAEGQKLDLIGLSVTLSYRSGAQKTVAFADFEENGITVSPKSGTELAFADNGMNVTVNYSTVAACSFKISVVSSACEHTSTEIVHVEPTCAELGFERTVCRICGTVLSEQIFPKNGQHNYAAWETVTEATDTTEGLKKRACALCGAVDQEVIPALGGDPGDVTEIGGDDPDDPNNDGDESEENLNDVSKVFLTVVIIVFSLGILAIVGITYLRHKRKEEMRARMARRAAAYHAQRSAQNGGRAPSAARQPQVRQGVGHGGNRR